MKMQKLSIKLENCYGIKKLVKELSFTEGKTIALYAQNGVMKTSFAKTFGDISEGKNPGDRIRPELTAVFEIIDDSTALQILSEQIFVIEPYNDQSFKSGERVLTLLVEKSLREEYQKIYADLEDKKKEVVKRLKKISGSSDCEKEVLVTFSGTDGNFFDILKTTEADMSASGEVFGFPYHSIFDKGGEGQSFP